ncbi:MAG: family 10 glycosylhydrolase [Capsulimonadales bacterium]|nr:family 10 glycosylhydrolase [Capsulimonadales bacterium]
MPNSPALPVVLALLLMAGPSIPEAVAQPPSATSSPSSPENLPAVAPNEDPLPTATDVETGEVRALWIVRDTLTSPAKIRNAVTLAKKYGFNTLFVQVRGRGDAFYQSRFEPRSESLSRQPADFDPLAVAIEEGHRAGLEVHAWMNTFLVWHQRRLPYSSRHVINLHPEWLVRDRQNRIAMIPTNDAEGAFLDPAIPAVREYLRNVFMDVVSRYDIDGLHFDYVRYPSERFSFSETSLAAFRDYLSERLSDNDLAYAAKKRAKNRLADFYLFPTEWREWRRGTVTETVRGISEEAHRLKPNLVISAAVFPNYRVASHDKGQAWREWLRDGLLDAACPMAYNRSTPVVASQIRDAVANSYGKPIIAGVGAWQMPAASAIVKGQVCRDLGAGGLNFFSYDGMTREGRTEAYLERVRNGLFSSRTVPPNWRRKPPVRSTDGKGG